MTNKWFPKPFGSPQDYSLSSHRFPLSDIADPLPRFMFTKFTPASTRFRYLLRFPQKEDLLPLGLCKDLND
jgi:hypothetical protein